MMQRILLSSVVSVLAIGIVAGCGSPGGVTSPSNSANSMSNSNAATNTSNSSNLTNTSNPNNSAANNNTLASKTSWPSVINEIMNSVQGKTNVPLLAPTYVPKLSGSIYLTATTQSNAVNSTSYNVDLLWTNSPVSVNSPSLSNLPLQNQLGSFGGIEEGSQTNAMNELTLLNHDQGIIPQTRGVTSNLGYGIIGKAYREGTATSVQWHEGRWLFEVNNNSGTVDVLARQIVRFTQTNMLPIPDQQGLVIVNVTLVGSSTTSPTQVFWTKSSRVYYTKMRNNPIEALQMAVSMKPFKS